MGRTARRQIRELGLHYLSLSRPEAVNNLHAAVEAALAKIDEPATRPRRFPAAYSGLASLDMLWIKQHSYWFGYVKGPNGVMTIANVVYQSANIPARVEPFQ